MAAQSPVDDFADLDDFWESEDLGLGQEGQRADSMTFETQPGGSDDLGALPRSTRPTRSLELSFLPLSDWDPSNAPQDRSPNIYRYIIQWKLPYNGRSKVKTTEQDVFLAPGDYWKAVPKEKVQQDKKKKLPKAPACPDDTAVVVSIRSKRDVPMAFDGLEIGWTDIEKQMLEWARP